MKLKTTILALITLSANATLAGTMGPDCKKMNIETACKTTAWSVGAKALYMQAGYSDNQRTAEQTFTAANGEVSTVGAASGYGWGFFVEASYLFNYGSDFNLNWYHLDNNFQNTSSLAANGSSTKVINPQWNAANFEFGQQIHVGDDKKMRVHAGVQYGYLHRNASFLSVVNVANPALADLALGVNSGQGDIGYNGFGPRVGIDLAYLPQAWLEGLDIYANTAIALLAGSSKYSLQRSSLLGPVSGKRNIVVPEIDLKLGINYTHAVYHGALTLDVGWMWADYISAILESPVGTMEDMSFEGLFFGLKWQGDIA
ncbi:MAG: Lpg1974 family pore-forming outer membrane protein [Gammaproteobacteria bacterium]|nr:Lpg1974 family pore-forming outer membrane protein [Gammaproteobacteria bacterium]